MYGQKTYVWFDAGLKVQVGKTALFNQAIADSDLVDYSLSNGFSYGGKFGINLGEGNSGFTFDLMFSDFKGEFENQDFMGQAEFNMKAMELYVLFRNEQNLSYFEIGPKFSFLRDASRRFIGEGLPGTSEDVTDQFKNGITGVLGFGFNLIGTDGAFTGKIGLRFEYGITDIVNDSGQALFAPLGIQEIYNEGYKGSHPIFAGVVFEINWGLGYFAKTKCGGRTKFFSL